MPAAPVLAVVAVTLVLAALAAALLARHRRERSSSQPPALPDPPTGGASPRVRRLAGPDEAREARVKALTHELEGLRRELRGAEERELPRRADQLRELIRERERQLQRLERS